MLNIGITGGIGSGKSTICKIFECLGFPVYYADERSRWIIDHTPGILQAIAEEFGPEFIIDGNLDRSRLGQYVFTDKNKLEVLNNIVHPFVIADFANWRKLQRGAATISEAAIYFETGRYKDFHKMILVTAPLDLRIARVQERSNLSKEDILQRIGSQWADEQKIPLADFVIVNDERSGLIEQVVVIGGRLAVGD